jgi:hypothetical protein
VSHEIRGRPVSVAAAFPYYALIARRFSLEPNGGARHATGIAHEKPPSASHGLPDRRMRGNIGNDLNSFQCPGGLDHPAVRECFAAIAGEECGLHPVESITRMEKCRSGALCLK